MVKSRYNPLRLSTVTPRYFDDLERLGLIEQKRGFCDRRAGGQGRETRAWPTPELKRLFAKMGATPAKIHSPNRECIVLRDAAGKNIEYEAEPADVAASRALLGRYNALLEKTLIDIPGLADRYIVRTDSHGKQVPLWVERSERFTRRIFNRGDWSKGGRFYGGWWQNCPEEWRRDIYINGRPTAEIDYSSFHLVMLYARKGISYWEDLGDDPYQIDLPEDIKLGPQQARSLCKKLMLIAINAENDQKAIRSLRQEAIGLLPKGVSDRQLVLLLDMLKEKHRPISEFFASDAGIELMRQDSEITAKLMELFTDENEPILTIHDSYIVDRESADKLAARMKRAFEEVTGVPAARLDVSFVC